MPPATSASGTSGRCAPAIPTARARAASTSGWRAPTSSRTTRTSATTAAPTSAWARARRSSSRRPSSSSAAPASGGSRSWPSSGSARPTTRTRPRRPTSRPTPESPPSSRATTPRSPPWTAPSAACGAGSPSSTSPAARSSGSPATTGPPAPTATRSRGARARSPRAASACPASVEWPGRIPRGKSSIPCGTVDIHPTLLELAGAGAALEPRPLDGTSLVALLAGRPFERERPLGFWVRPAAGILVRSGVEIQALSTDSAPARKVQRAPPLPPSPEDPRGGDVGLDRRALQAARAHRRGSSGARALRPRGRSPREPRPRRPRARARRGHAPGARGLADVRAREPRWGRLRPVRAPYDLPRRNRTTPTVVSYDRVFPEVRGRLQLCASGGARTEGSFGSLSGSPSAARLRGPPPRPRSPATPSRREPRAGAFHGARPGRRLAPDPPRRAGAAALGAHAGAHAARDDGPAGSISTPSSARRIPSGRCSPRACAGRLPTRTAALTAGSSPRAISCAPGRASRKSASRTSSPSRSGRRSPSPGR